MHAFSQLEKALRRFSVWGRVRAGTDGATHVQAGGSFRLFRLRGHLGPCANRMMYFQAEGSFQLRIGASARRHGRTDPPAAASRPGNPGFCRCSVRHRALPLPDEPAKSRRNRRSISRATAGSPGRSAHKPKYTSANPS